MSAPAAASSLVARARVTRRIAAAAARPVTLIVAPAGYGKTVALEHFLACVDSPYVRYDVRSDGGALLGFVRGFCEAFAGLAPSARRAVTDAYRSALSAANPGKLLASWMCNHLPQGACTVAIDDLQIAQGDAACVEFVVTLVELTKARNRWILSTRSGENLPLGSWLAYGDADVPVSEDDLKFTPEEAREAARAGGAALDERSVDRLFEQTGGWAMAFTLALHASRESTDVAKAASAARGLSYDYLAEHVYRTLTEQERALLLFAIVLPEIDVAVLEAAGFDGARTILEGLQRHSTLVCAVPEAGAVLARLYRCHDLLRDYLEHEVASLDEESRGTLVLRAARALHAAGRTLHALRLYARARAHDETIALLHAEGSALLLQAHGDSVQAAIDSLPESQREGHPAVLGLRGQREYMAGRNDRAEALFERAVQRCDDRPLHAMLVARLSLARFYLGKDLPPQLEELSFDRTLPPSVRGELLSMLVAHYARSGRFEGLDALMDEAEALALGSDSDVACALMLQRLGAATYHSGDAARGERLFASTAKIALANHMYRTAAFSYISLSASALSNEGDLAKAAAYSRSAAEAAAKSGARLSVLVAEMEIALLRGDDAELRRLLTANAEPDYSLHVVNVRRAQAMLTAWEGRFAEAARLLDNTASRADLCEYRALDQAHRALFYAISGERERAESAAEEALRESRSQQSRRPSFARVGDVARSLAALALALAGRATASQRALRERLASERDPVSAAVRAACERICAGIECGVTLDDVAEPFAALRAADHGGYVRTLSAALERTARDEEPSLTPAELAALRLVAEGRTSKEVAAALGCTVHTVRWHVRRAIAKFGCSGREQAIRAARARNLL